MKIRLLNKETYAGTSFTARYRTCGFYDICPSENSFQIEYVPFEAPVEKFFTDELFGKWLEDPVAFGAFENGKLLGFVEGSMESWNNRFRISNICLFEVENRRAGIGTLLMDTITRQALSLGAMKTPSLSIKRTALSGSASTATPIPTRIRSDTRSASKWGKS